MNTKEILQRHIDSEGKIDLEAAANDINQTIPNSFVSKEDFNDKNKKLKEANDTIETLNQKAEQVDTLTEKLESAQSEAAAAKRQHAIDVELVKAGADEKYHDVLVAKIPENLDLDNLSEEVSKLKEEYNKLFDLNDDADKEGGNGYRVEDNRLKGDKPEKTFTMEDIEKMTTDEINENWSDIQSTLEE